MVFLLSAGPACRRAEVGLPINRNVNFLKEGLSDLVITFFQKTKTLVYKQAFVTISYLF